MGVRLTSLSVLVLALSLFATGGQAFAGPAQTTSTREIASCETLNFLTELPSGDIAGIDPGGNCGGRAAGIVKFTATGRFEENFGDQGFLPLPIDTSDPYLNGLRGMEGDQLGRIILTGGRQIAAILPDGTLDPAFGSGGILDTQASTPAGPGLIGASTTQPDGKLVVAGFGGPGILISRYLENGSIDPTFGSGGSTGFDIAGVSGANPASVSNVSIDPEGRVVVGLSLQRFYDNEYTALIRLKPDGTPDPTFGVAGSGLAESEPGSDYEGSFGVSVSAIHFDESGAISLIGQRTIGLKAFTSGYGVTFDSSGIETGARTSLGAAQGYNPTAFDSEGRALATGYQYTDYLDTERAALVNRYLPGWGRDPAFGSTDGVFRGYFGPFAANMVDVLPLRDGDGYVISGSLSSFGCHYGPVADPCRSYLALARLDPKGRLVNSFGTHRGLATFPVLECSLGEGSDGGPGWESRARCLAKGQPFTFDAKVMMSGTRQPSLRIAFGSLPNNTGICPEGVSCPGTTRLTVALPRSIRVVSRRFRGAISVRSSGGSLIPKSHVSLTGKPGHRFIHVGVNRKMETPTDVRVTLGRGSIKKLVRSRAPRRLRFQGTVINGGTLDKETIATETDRIRVQTARLG